MCVFGTCGFALRVHGSVVLRMFFQVRALYVFAVRSCCAFLLFGAVGNITRDFPFDWIVFASVSYNLRASHSPIVLKIRTRNFSIAATSIITETPPPNYGQCRNSLLCSLISTMLIASKLVVDFLDESLEKTVTPKSFACCYHMKTFLVEFNTPISLKRYCLKSVLLKK